MDISQDKIFTIEANYPTDTQKQCYEMFDTWLKSNNSACWCDFVQALNIVRRDDIAENVTTYLKRRSESSTVAVALPGTEYRQCCKPYPVFGAVYHRLATYPN